MLENLCLIKPEKTVYFPGRKKKNESLWGNLGVNKVLGGEMGEVGKAMGLLISGTLVYYHCSYRDATILSLFADVLIVLLCSLAILGLLFRQLNVS